MLRKYNSRNDYKQEILKAAAYIVTAFFVLQYINDNIAETLSLVFLACFSYFAPNIELFHYPGNSSNGKKEQKITVCIHIFVPLLFLCLYFLFQNSTPLILLTFKTIIAFTLSFLLKQAQLIKVWIFETIFPFWVILLGYCLKGETLSFFNIFFNTIDFESFDTLVIGNLSIANSVQILNIFNLLYIYFVLLFCSVVFGQKIGSAVTSFICFTVSFLASVFDIYFSKSFSFNNIGYIRDIPEVITGTESAGSVIWILITFILFVIAYVCYRHYSFTYYSRTLLKKEKVVRIVLAAIIALFVLSVEIFAPFLIVKSFVY